MRLRPELVVLAALLACAPRAAPAPAAPPVAALDDSEITTWARLLAMQDRRVLDTAYVASALAHPRALLRAQAALAAGRIGDLAAAPLLRAALDDPDPDVAAAAAFALGELTDSSAAAVERLAALAGPLGWARPAAAAEAAHALGKIAGPQALPGLWPALTADAPPDVLHEALLAVWRLPRTPESVASVQRHLADVDPETRWRAAYALMRMAAPTSIPALLAALADPDPRVRAAAARGLRPVTADSAEQRVAARLALRTAVADSHPHVVINAARALAAFGVADDAAVLAPLLRNADGNVAVAAAGALGDLDVPTSAAPLEAMTRSADSPLSARAAALAALARIAPARATAIAQEWASSPEWLTRFYAARALGAAPWHRARPILTALARDVDPRVGAEAVGAVADTATTAYPLYIEALAARDVMVRAAGARGLAARPRPMDMPILLQAYARAATDSLNDAAIAAVEALGALVATGTPADRAFFVRFPRSPDPIVRRAVAVHIGPAWGDVAAVETGRSSADYAAVIRELIVPVLGGYAPPRVRIRTDRGDIVLELAPVQAPLTVANFLGLIRAGFYGGTDLRWHRVVPNFVLQDGDPRGDGSGGPARAIRDEMNRLRYERGTLGMALAGPDTGGSQFFLTHSPQPHLDGGYTVFGRVVEGMAVADAIVQDDRILAIEVVP
jgi:cyclophilin family peptidyl-prolyl cis-trans isomerase